MMPKHQPSSSLEDAAQREESQRKSNTSLSGISYPGNNDVMLGRGGESNYHNGNLNFRRFAESYRTRYKQASKVEKPLISAELVAAWRGLQPAGRFLTRTDPARTDSLWHDVGDAQAVKRATKTLGERPQRERRAEKAAKLKLQKKQQKQQTCSSAPSSPQSPSRETFMLGTLRASVSDSEHVSGNRERSVATLPVQPSTSSSFDWMLTIPAGVFATVRAPNNQPTSSSRAQKRAGVTRVMGSLALDMDVVQPETLGSVGIPDATRVSEIADAYFPGSSEEIGSDNVDLLLQPGTSMSTAPPVNQSLHQDSSVTTKVAPLDASSSCNDAVSESGCSEVWTSTGEEGGVSQGVSVANSVPTAAYLAQWAFDDAEDSND